MLLAGRCNISDSTQEVQLDKKGAYLWDPAPTIASTPPPLPEGMTSTIYSQSSFGLRSPNTVGEGSSVDSPGSFR